MVSTAFSPKLSAQSCAPEADFTFTVNGCNAEFQPTYNGQGTVTHFWTFNTVGVGYTSTSNISSPLHTFGSGGFTTRSITHTISVGGINYTCTKEFTLNCSQSCDDKSFGYAVNNCTVTFDGDGFSQSWDFGDGATSGQVDPTHTYTADGDYIVTFSNGLDICQKTIRVLCSTEPPCCTAAFEGEITQECSVLRLNLDAACTESGVHVWTIEPNVPNSCGSPVLAGFFQGAPVLNNVQITNINTTVITALVVTHQYICPDSTILSETKTFNIPASGIFIGKDNQTSLLTAYECVLPGSFYNSIPTVYSSGIVRIDKDFTFSSSEVQFEPGVSGFNVLGTKTLTLQQGTVLSSNTNPACNCLWRGIQVETNATLVSKSGTQIQDALYAIRPDGGSILDIRETDFKRNFVGIRSTEGSFTFTAFEKNDFDGSGPLLGICDLTGKEPSVNTFFACEASVPYLTERGYAGMFIKNAGSLNLPQLAYANQNIFHDLAVGIDAYDTDLTIRKNSRFNNIRPGAYELLGGICYGGTALRFSDSELAGANGILFAGNGKFGPGGPDIDACSNGVLIFSGVTATPATGTRVQISGSKITNIQTGVFLTDYCATGTFSGKTTDFYKGIFDNYIKVNPGIIVPIFADGTGGIWLTDYSPTQSSLEFANNTIDVDQDEPSFGSFGIRILGYLTSGVLDDAVQTDINRNEININTGARGIILGNHTGAWVHDHRNDAQTGAGIFLHYQHDNFSTGITVGGNGEHTIGCNDIVSTLPNNHGMRVSTVKNCTFSRNTFTGGQYSSVFRSLCTDTRFACNTLTGYTVNGLRLESGAVLGPQGTSGTMTHGNQWISANPALIGAFADPTVIVSNSIFYVRNNGLEFPSINIPPNLWFIPNVPNNISPTCYYDCPIVPPQQEEFGEPQLTLWDDSVAVNAVTFNYYPEASTWIATRNLYEKLIHSPALSENNTVMQNLKASFDNTAMAGLVHVNLLLDSISSANSTQKATLESGTQQVHSLLTHLENLDSLIRTSADSVTLTQLVSKRDSLSDELAVLQLALESVYVQLREQTLNGVAIVENSLNEIVPTNAYEENEKATLKIYLDTYIVGQIPTTGQLDTLYQIGNACPLVSGPTVYNARNLYEKFTGVVIPDVDCPEQTERSDSDHKAVFSESNMSLLLSPNPANGYTELSIRSENDKFQLIITDPLGNMILEEKLYSNNYQIKTDEFPGGIYFVRVISSNTQAATSAFIVQH